jgi:serine protease Do
MFSLSAVKWSIPARLLVIITSLLLITPGDLSKFQQFTSASYSSELLDKIDEIAKSVSVKINAKDTIGSGALVHRQGNLYTVVTNKHVLRSENPPYWINTPDGKSYEAQIVGRINFAKYDLALLQFRSEKTVYSVAAIGNSANLTVGDEVFAAGYPHRLDKNLNLTDNSNSSSNSLGLAIRPGRISIILDQNLEEGYKIGYTNDVEKGMSGGPLLNDRGELVGINGKHAYPLWDAPDIYEDNSQPCQPLQDLINRSSLAIPIEKVLQFTPELTKSKNERLSSPLTNVKIQPIKADSEQKKPLPKPILRMKEEAEARKNCTNLSPKSGSSGARIEL